MLPVVGRTDEEGEFAELSAELPLRLFAAFSPTFDPVVLDDLGRGEVLDTDPSDEPESTSVTGGPEGLELRGGDKGLPMCCRLLSTFSTPPERQWTFFGDEDPVTCRQGCSMIEAMATGQDLDLQRTSPGLSNSAGLERCVGRSANEGVQRMSNVSRLDPV